MCCIEQTLSHADTSESASGRMVNCSHAAIPKKKKSLLPAASLPPYLTQVRLFFSFPSGARMGSAPIINPSLYLPTYLTYQVRGYSLCAGGTNTAFSAKHVGYHGSVVEGCGFGVPVSPGRSCGETWPGWAIFAGFLRERFVLLLLRLTITPHPIRVRSTYRPSKLIPFQGFSPAPSRRLTQTLGSVCRFPAPERSRRCFLLGRPSHSTSSLSPRCDRVVVVPYTLVPFTHRAAPPPPCSICARIPGPRPAVRDPGSPCR